jgi:hypothetical protein
MTALTPIITNKNIENSYVKLNPEDTVISSFETSRTVEFNGTTGSTVPYDPRVNRFNTSIPGVSAFITSITGSTSSHYNSVALSLFNKDLDRSLTSNDVLLCRDLGVVILKKILFDSKIKKGTFTMTATGTNAAALGSLDIESDYYDDGYSNIVQRSSGNNVGVIDYDLGMIVVTSSVIREVAVSLTSVKYDTSVKNTNISVFCKCDPLELNYTLNNTFLATASLSSLVPGITKQGPDNIYTGEPLTASTTASVFDQRFYESNSDFMPYITSVGLYDDDNNCLAVAKLTRPLQKPSDLPITFRVSVDI